MTLPPVSHHRPTGRGPDADASPDDPPRDDPPPEAVPLPPQPKRSNLVLILGLAVAVVALTAAVVLILTRPWSAEDPDLNMTPTEVVEAMAEADDAAAAEQFVCDADASIFHSYAARQGWVWDNADAVEWVVHEPSFSSNGETASVPVRISVSDTLRQNGYVVHTFVPLMNEAGLWRVCGLEV